jgi:uncharacterized membrane protein YhaH (DUF805 family)
MLFTFGLFIISEPFTAGLIGLWVIFALAAILFTLYCYWRVAEKCGYPGVYSLLLLIPLVNIVVHLYWVFAEWPIEAEVKRLRASRT